MDTKYVPSVKLCGFYAISQGCAWVGLGCGVFFQPNPPWSSWKRTQPITRVQPNPHGSGCIKLDSFFIKKKNNEH